jgi:polyhydroxybutyrate depolymerase
MRVAGSLLLTMGGLVLVACSSHGEASSDEGPPPAATAPAEPKMDLSADASPEPPIVLAPTSDAGLPNVDIPTVPEPGELPDPCIQVDRPTGDVEMHVGDRRFVLHVPKAYDPTKKSMLVVNIHGLTETIGMQEALTHMNVVADDENFLVLYPEGKNASFNAGDCCDPSRMNKVDDVGYVRDAIAHAEKRYCVDPAHVHATGMSNGGFLSYRLACELSDTIASIAPVAGSLGIPEADCKPTRPIAVWQTHGTDDKLVPYGGGHPFLLGNIYTFRSAAETSSFWQDFDACPAASKTTFQKDDATCETWGPCKAGTEVTLCTVKGGGHTWPGGFDASVLPGVGQFLGMTTKAFDASRVMIDFFRKHPKP